MIFRFPNRSTVLAAFVLWLAAISSFAQTPPNQSLALNQTIEQTIKGGEKHFYIVNIGANQTARVEIEQKGVDVSLAAHQPDGERYIETESPSGILGSDLILVTAIEAGEYKIEISPADPKAGAGKYTIRFAETRPTVPQDHEINAAAKLITKVADETNVLRQKGTVEGRRQALEKFQEVVALSKIKRDKVWEIVAVISSGLICDQLGEMQKSLDFYLRGLQLSRESGNREYEGASLNNLGNGYKTLGEYQQAIFYLEQALRIDREIGDRQGEGIVLNNLGSCHLLLRNLPEAESFFRQSLPIRSEIKDRRGTGNTLNNLGLVFLQSGDTAKAVDFLQQALIVRREIGDKAGEATTLRNLGRSFWDAGDKPKAAEKFEQTNALAKQLGDRRIEADSFYWLARVERDKNNLPKAIENIENGLQIIERIRGELVNPDLRTAYFSTVQQFYEFYTDLLVARYEKSKDANDIALTLQISERARTRSLIELLQEANINIRQGVDQKTLEQAQDLQNSVNAKYRQRTQAVSRKGSDEQIAKITNEINLLATELENVQVKIRRENPRYADLTQGTTLSGAEIQNLLDDETVLLEYKLGATRSFLWLVTKNSTEIHTLPARTEIETAAKDFYNSIVSRDRTKEAQTTELSNKLSEILLAPIAGKIQNKRLAIVADGVLHLVPFSALPKVETNEIVVLPSAGVLAELRRNGNERPMPEKTLAVFADPIFEANDPRLKNLSEPPATAGGLNARRNPPADAGGSDLRKVLRDFNLGENLPRLLSSREEARNISNLLPKTQTEMKVDFEANRENVLNGTLAGYRILHFATHGLLDTAHPESSGLVFSLYDKNGKLQDGFLRLNQIYNLNLTSDLVVLSACQTALGKDVRGEGLIGLTRGFMFAGAKRIAASLWKVDDAATAEFMRRFYQNLLQKKLAPASALKQAQTEMKKIPRFKSPYFWAGFTLQGDWQ